MYIRRYLSIFLAGYAIAATSTYAEEESRRVILLPSPFGTIEVKAPAEAPAEVKSAHDTSIVTNHGAIGSPSNAQKEALNTPTTLPNEVGATNTTNESREAPKPTIQPSIKSTITKPAAPTKMTTIATPLDFRSKVPTHTNHDLNQQLNSLKREVIGISQAIESLEESLMTSHDNHLNGYFSTEETPGFTLESLSLTLNDKIIDHHFYNPREMNALQRGAVQRLFNTAIVNGEHELIATIQGTLNEKPYTRNVVITFQKGAGTKYVQLDIKKQVFTKEPAFQFRTWE